MEPTQTLRVDLASDTVTKPSAEMRAAMAGALVGDDVMDEDPTIQALEAKIAELLGMEDAIYVPSGTMSNQIAIRLHCRPGDELLCEESSHINTYEQAAHVQLSGVSARAIVGKFGVLQPEQFHEMIRPDDVHCVRTRLVCLENTHNKGGGTLLPYEGMVEICDWAEEHGIARHLDGARLFNAVVASGRPATDWAKHFETVSICFSKGLGAPVGSALCGSSEMIIEAKRHRKLFGGGMRQAGVIAAGALYALENNIERLAEDHAKAAQLAATIRNTPGLELAPDPVETNIVFFKVDKELGGAREFSGRLLARGVRMLALDPKRIRAVTHLGISAEDIEEACAAIELCATDAANHVATATEGQSYA